MDFLDEVHRDAMKAMTQLPGLPVGVHRVGIAILGAAPLTAIVMLALVRPSWLESTAWTDRVYLAVIVAIGLMLLVSVTWAVKTRYHGLYTFTAVCIFVGVVAISSFGAAVRLLELPPFLRELPGLGGFSIALVIGAWDSMHSIYARGRDTAPVRRRGLLVVLAFFPVIALAFVRPFDPAVLFFGIPILFGQSLILVRLLFRSPRSLGFLPAAVACGLLADALGFLRLGPASAFLPPASGMLILALAPWMLLGGVRGAAEERS
jgi:hypothetical protein